MVDTIESYRQHTKLADGLDDHAIGHMLREQLETAKSTLTRIKHGRVKSVTGNERRCREINEMPPPTTITSDGTVLIA